MRRGSLLAGSIQTRLKVGISVAALVAAGTTGVSSVAAQPAAPPSTDDAAGVRVIVMLEGDATFAAVGGQRLDAAGKISKSALADVTDRRAQLRTRQKQVLAAAENAGIKARERHAFTDVVNALAVSVRASDVDRLGQLRGVAAVVTDERAKAATDVSVPLVGAPEVWERTDDSGAPVRGSGTTVAILDSGVDYSHPSLGEGFGAGHKVVGGYDFVNNDPDPMDDNGHGTHVAGIVAGDGAVKGVAPAASLMAYKVLDGRGQGWESDIIAGLEAAVDPKNPNRADVVNMSLGGPGDGTDPLGQAASAAVDAGVVVVASAGNSGPGSHTVSSPAVADGVLSVGASVSGISLPEARMVSPRNELIQTFRAPYSASPPEEPVTGELVDVGEGTDDDYADAGDVDGKVVAIRANIPGSLSDVSPYYIEQARRAEDRGAIALLAYTQGFGGPVALSDDPSAPQPSANEPGIVDIPLPGTESGDSFRMDDIVVLGLADLQWDQLRRDLAQGTVEISISGEDVTDSIASFSSRGPTDDYRLKPEIVAPGAEIRSAWPTTQWEPGVYRLSGTSMAAPHVAGAAALLRQLEPNASVGDTTSRLTGSAAPIEDVQPATTGAGRLDVAAAAGAQVVADSSALSLGLADLSTSKVSASGVVTLKNVTAEPVTVSLDTKKAPGTVGSATATASADVIPAGGEIEVTVTASARRAMQDGDVSGWMVAQIDGGATSVRVPYLLALRPLVVQTSPDPSDGTSEVFVWSPTPLASEPSVTVTPPRGASYEVVTRHDHGSWYRGELRGTQVGAYEVDAQGQSESGLQLRGKGSFEVAANTGQGGAAGWQSIGPNSESGQIATTPADSDVAAVSQYLKAGPWTTDDGGDTWQQHNRLPVAGGHGDVIVDASDPETMWYAVNGSTGGFVDVLLDPTYEGKVLRTHDGGSTWQELDVPNVHIDALVSDDQTQTLVAVTDDTLFVSRDGGEQWSEHPNDAGSELIDVAVGGDDVYLANSSGVWAVRGIIAGEPTATEQVYDSGGEWSQGVDGLVADDVVIAMLTRTDDVRASHDGGSTWELLYDVPNGGALDLVMSDGTIMVSTYRQTQHLGRDHGASWSEVPQPVNGAIEDDFASWGDGLMWSSPGAGLFHTDDNGDNPRRVGVPGRTAHDLAIADGPDGTSLLLAGTDADVYSTELPTTPKLAPDVTEWGLSGYEAYVGTRVGQLATDPQNPSTVWKVRKDALSQFWVYRSTDGGADWELRGRTSEVPFDILVSPNDSDRVVVPFWSLGGVGLYVTDDAGETWRKLFHSEMFTTVAADPANPDRLWLGSASGLYRSDDFGKTVVKVAAGEVTTVGVSGSTIVAGGDQIIVSGNGGRSFSTAESGDLQMQVTDVIVSPEDYETWYAASGSFAANGLVKGGRGVLQSTDGGETWVNISSGLENLSAVSLAVSSDGDWLYAGTEHGGVHRIRVN